MNQQGAEGITKNSLGQSFGHDNSVKLSPEDATEFWGKGKGNELTLWELERVLIGTGMWSNAGKAEEIYLFGWFFS